MKIIIIGGFLGSGKTTTILSLGRHLSDGGKRVAIIVNEIGDIGIDGDVISKYGFKTREITNGCICCTLKRDMKYTIYNLMKEYGPDFTLIEPTGIAFPLQIKDEIMRMDLQDVSFAPIVTLIDGTRFKQQLKETKNFTQRQITDAEILCINKTDIIKPIYIPIISTALSQINSSAYMLPLSATTKDGFEKLRGMLEEESDTRPHHITSDDSIVASGVAAYSNEYVINVENMPAATAVRISKDILIQIRDKIKEINPDFVGHIKLSFEHSDVSLRGSVTASTIEPVVERMSKRNGGGQSIKVLSAVSNVKEGQIKSIADNAIMEIFSFEGIAVKKTEHHHH